jgi:hypothetical protein
MFVTRFSFREWLALLALLLLPLIIQLPAILGYWNPDPSLFVGAFGDSIKMSGGYPWIDPNTGFQAQALGKLSADQWLMGRVPWWNTFNGVGLPLAAEAQPGSLFLPFVLLYHFRDGGFWVELLLQIIAGYCTYALLRTLKITVLAAFAGAALFELNGTFAWHGAPIIAPVAFLPMLLLGIEMLRERVREGRSGGWWLIPLALSWSLYAGFPETAYIDGLLAGVWVLARLGGLDRRQQLNFLTKLSLAVCVGMLCSLPLLVPFAEYLSLAYVGGHDGAFAHASLPGASAVLSALPWLFGPIDRFNDQAAVIGITWGNIGGYLTALQVAVAILGIMLAPRRLSLALLIWMLLCLAKSFDLRPVSDLMNLLPMVKSAAFFRYSPPSWEFCSSVLIALAINGLQKGVPLSFARQSFVFVLCLLLIGGGLWLERDVVEALFTATDYPTYFYCSVAWLLFSLLAGMAFIGMRRWWRPHAYFVVTLLLIDACLAFSLPIFSGAQDVQKVEPGVAFLKSHSGLQRIYSLGPLAANYGGYFQIAQINHNYLPISREWVDYIHKHLDPSADLVTFIGEGVRTDHRVGVETELQNRHAAYEELAIKYVLAPFNTNPFVKTLATPVEATGNHEFVLKEKQFVSFHWHLPPASAGSRITALAVKIGNYGGHSDGLLNAEICIKPDACADGKSSLRGSTDNSALNVLLDRPLDLPSQGPLDLSIKFGYEQSKSAIVIWNWPIVADSTHQLVEDKVTAGYAPAVSLELLPKGAGEAGRLVYSKPDMNIYELNNPKPYFEVVAGSCNLKSISRLTADMNCKGHATLLRREAFYPGWRASVNGLRVPLNRSNEIFQSVNLTAGSQRITFTYVPSYFWQIMIGFCVGLVGLLYAALTSRTRCDRGLHPGSQ